MTGRGKKGTGSGKGGAKHHQKILPDDIQGITNPPTSSLVCHVGVKRISELIYKETEDVLKVFLDIVICHAVTCTKYTKRKTNTAMDIVYVSQLVSFSHFLPLKRVGGLESTH